MTDRPRYEVIPPRPKDRRYSSMPTDTRLGHEHDQNDALKARIDWYEQFKDLERRIQKEAVLKANDERIKKRAGLWPMLVFIQLLAILEIILLKFMGVI